MSETNINKPTEYSLIDNNKKYLPSRFVFVPTICLTSNSETIKNAIAEQTYYNVENDDFVCKITHKDPSEPSSHIVCETDEENVYVCKYTKSDGGIEYVACSSKNLELDDVLDCQSFDATNVMVKIPLDGQNVALSYFYDTSNDKSLKHIQTDNNHKPYIQIPSDYDSLEINSSDVYFRKENNNDKPSWVTISNGTVLFSSDIEPRENIIEPSDNNFKIKLKDTYSCNSMIDVDLANAYAELYSYTSTQSPSENLLISALGHEISALVKTAQDTGADLSDAATTDLNSAASALKKATDLSSATSALSSAASALNSAASAFSEVTDLGNAATKLNSAATDLGNATTDLNSAKSALKAGFSYILNTSLSLKQDELFDIINNKATWKKISSVENTDSTIATIITDRLVEYQGNVISKNFEDENFTKSFNGLMYIYAIYKSTDNIGLVDMSTKDVVVNQSPVIKEILKYNGLDLSDIKSIEMFALDNENKMIIYKNSDNSYNLVYLENYKQNGDRILPEGVSFLTTTHSTKP